MQCTGTKKRGKQKLKQYLVFKILRSEQFWYGDLPWNSFHR
jgi:hypothetical protein